MNNLDKNSIIPFGKYRGYKLSEIVNADPQYFDWLENNVNNYHFCSDIKTQWTEILDYNDTAPFNGLYIIACRGDNHIVYELYKLVKGDRFVDKYIGNNSHSNGWFCVECLAYIYCDDFSVNPHIWENRLRPVETYNHIMIYVLNVISDEQALLIENENSYTALYDESQKLLYCLTDTLFLKMHDVKGFRAVPQYTEVMHSHHCELWYSIHNNK